MSDDKSDTLLAMEPLNFGIFDWVEAASGNLSRQPAQIYEHKIELAAAAERAGFHAFFIAEHHGTPRGNRKDGVLCQRRAVAPPGAAKRVLERAPGSRRPVNTRQAAHEPPGRGTSLCSAAYRRSRGPGNEQRETDGFPP